MTGFIQDRGSGKKLLISIFKKCQLIFLTTYKQFSIYNISLIFISLVTLKIIVCLKMYISLLQLLDLITQTVQNCVHQCKKCGILYDCDEAMTCGMPFQYGKCSLCEGGEGYR